ncbi:MAG: gamma-glutamylcyclotransferase [Hyphomicrobiaceae bacterium]
MKKSDDLWVFGYGSLMWRPGFAFLQALPGQVIGFQRAFCIYSTHHRGSERRPGLVLGLDRGGSCSGMVYRVSHEHRLEAIRYLRAREQVSGVYREALLPVTIGHDQAVTAVTYVVERAHPSYVHRLPISRQVDIIRGARGRSGPNVEYLVNTTKHLRALDIRDPSIERLAVAAGGLFAAPHADADVLQRRAHALPRLCRAGVVPRPQLRPNERRRFLYRLALA